MSHVRSLLVGRRSDLERQAERDREVLKAMAKEMAETRAGLARREQEIVEIGMALKVIPE